MLFHTSLAVCLEQVQRRVVEMTRGGASISTYCTYLASRWVNRRQRWMDEYSNNGIQNVVRCRWPLASTFVEFSQVVLTMDIYGYVPT